MLTYLFPSGENCDDGNVRDGDGCNIQCQMEDVFRCKGRPSLCYRHDGDGICEDFEIKTSIKDCGFYTPEGFKDQWVYSAAANPKYTYVCEPHSIIGPPRPDLVSIDVTKGYKQMDLGCSNYLPTSCISISPPIENCPDH